MLRTCALLLLVTAGPALAQSAQNEGILLLAHGGQPDWNERVTVLADTINQTQPVEVAFGMASRPAIQSAVDRLIARGAKSIVAVPLFVSSHSSVVTSTAYLLGLRADMPPELKAFAKMNHGTHTAATPAGHEGHAMSGSSTDNTKVVDSPVPIRMTDALNHHSLVGAILIDRARALSTSPSAEAVVIVAHGPVPDEDNTRWLADMKILAEQMARETKYAAIDYLTVRDDAPKPIRDRATAELRGIVERHRNAGRRVLIVPLLLSYGGIEKGIRTRLEGLDYVLAPQALMPDPRIADWVRQIIAR